MPVWPRNYLGSISHSDELCVAHVAHSGDLLGIGVDLERLNALPWDLIGQISLPEEWECLSQGQTPDIDAAILCFSAKEAIYKAYFPFARAFLEFTDVCLRVDWARGSFAASMTADDRPSIAGRRHFNGRFARIGNYIATAVWIER